MTIAVHRVALYVAAIIAAAVSTGIAVAFVGNRGPDASPPKRQTLQSSLAERGWTFGVDESAEADLALVPFHSITFERGPCFGECPIYRMTLEKGGRAELTRDHLNPSLSASFAGQISPFHFARLAQLASLAKDAAEKSSYAGEWTDDYTATITAVNGNRTWKVSDYGQVAPPEVWALEELLHVAYKTTKWSQQGADN